MAIEQDIAELVQASNNLTGVVDGKIQDIDKKVSLAEKTIESYIAEAKNSFPFFNLFNNAKLSLLESDGITPSGFYVWRRALSVKLEVIKESDGSWWRTQGNFVRVTVTWDSPESLKYASIWAKGLGTVPSNAPHFIKTTRGFDYKVVKNDGIEHFSIGWESGRRTLDLSVSEWTKAEPLTYEHNQAEALCSFKVANAQPAGEFIVDIRNIFVNLGVGDNWGLGLNDLTSFPYTTLSAVEQNLAAKENKEGA
ncbi:hypothetical protein [Moritella viscosa]|uniref:hypothetical protein n=1 Tax=Moritella viscosa TaxID=80854 RepID=UPI00091C9C60|nr:hypothetical protein [Moritella viscosa]SGY86608.1 C-terminal processing peptidase-3, Serine peptidase, MEROPS family S41A [Moritella viscosa]